MYVCEIYIQKQRTSAVRSVFVFFFPSPPNKNPTPRGHGPREEQPSEEASAEGRRLSQQQQQPNIHVSPSVSKPSTLSLLLALWVCTGASMSKSGPTLSRVHLKKKILKGMFFFFSPFPPSLPPLPCPSPAGRFLTVNCIVIRKHRN